MAYTLYIEAKVTDDNGDEVATLSRFYEEIDLSKLAPCNAHFGKTLGALVEGVADGVLEPGTAE